MASMAAVPNGKASGVGNSPASDTFSSPSQQTPQENTIPYDEEKNDGRQGQPPDSEAPGNDENLTEVRAPQVINPRPRPTSDSLEDADKATNRSEDDRKLQIDRRNHWATRLYIHANLVFWAIMGTLARLGVQWLTFYPGAPIVFSNLWANVGGTLIMGFLVEDHVLFREEWVVPNESLRVPPGMDSDQRQAKLKAPKQKHGTTKKTIPLYIGLTTGFCGSFTSFSTFMRDVFFALSNQLPTPIDHPSNPLPLPTSSIARNGGYSFMAVLAVIFLTIGMSTSALYIGAHLAIALERFLPTLPFRLLRRLLDPLLVLLAAGCWLGAVFMSIWPPDRPDGPSSRASWSNETWRGEALLAVVFAPCGCLLRYYASLKLNSLNPAFPLGTFSVNMLGVAILSMCYSIQHVPLAAAGGLVGGGRVACQVLQGIEDGFDGCLTTVSTWIVELSTLRRRHAYIYGLCSVGLGLALTVVIMGSVTWTVGFVGAACRTGRY